MFRIALTQYTKAGLLLSRGKKAEKLEITENVRKQTVSTAVLYLNRKLVSFVISWG